MKKLLLLLVVVIISLSSCNLFSILIDETVYDLLESVEYYDFAEYDLSDIKSFKGIAAWIQHRIYYKEDMIETFTSPEDTLNRGSGDCDEFGILFQNIAYIVFGIKMDLVIVNTYSGRKIVEGGMGNHINVHYDGIVYSAQLGNEYYTQDILYIYSFDEVFY
ncbi:MAG: hypothetical protein ACTSO3_16740 [Candidatus Heimdallarchaeaceae archaeon]